MKVTRWTDTTFNRGMYVEVDGQSYTLLAGKDAGGVLQYRGFIEWDQRALLDEVRLQHLHLRGQR